MAENRNVKFCAWVGPRTISLVMTKCPPGELSQGDMTS